MLKFIEIWLACINVLRNNPFCYLRNYCHLNFTAPMFMNMNPVIIYAKIYIFKRTDDFTPQPAHRVWHVRLNTHNTSHFVKIWYRPLISFVSCLFMKPHFQFWINIQQYFCSYIPPASFPYENINHILKTAVK